MTKRTTAIAAVAASLGLGSALALGSIPDSGGVIHACYTTTGNTKGALRIIEPGGAGVTLDTSCDTAIEKAIDVNQTGPIGPTGAPGAQGNPGTAGSRGPTGATGDVGPAGAPGSNGTKGGAGPTGPAGKRGKRGPKGFKGKLTHTVNQLARAQGDLRGQLEKLEKEIKHRENDPGTSPGPSGSAGPAATPPAR